MRVRKAYIIRNSGILRFLATQARQVLLWGQEAEWKNEAVIYLFCLYLH